jgi:hypothetical protein
MALRLQGELKISEKGFSPKRLESDHWPSLAENEPISLQKQKMEIHLLYNIPLEGKSHLHFNLKFKR